jgi:hypothetical protein
MEKQVAKYINAPRKGGHLVVGKPVLIIFGLRGCKYVGSVLTKKFARLPIVLRAAIIPIQHCSSSTSLRPYIFW